MKTTIFRSGRTALALSVVGASVLAGGCATSPNGYGMSAQQINEEAVLRQQVANQDPVADNRGMYLSMIQEMQTKGLYFASLAHVDAFEQKFGVAPDVQLLRAHALREAGQAGQSEAVYRSLLDTKVGAAALQGLGLIAGARGDFPAAVAALRDAARKDPTNPLIVSDLGYALLRQGDLAGARLSIAQAAELAPGNIKIVGNLALYLLVMGEESRADAVMARADLSPGTRAAVRKMAMNLRSSETAPQTPAVAAAGSASARPITAAYVGAPAVPSTATAGAATPSVVRQVSTTPPAAVAQAAPAPAPDMALSGPPMSQTPGAAVTRSTDGMRDRRAPTGTVSDPSRDISARALPAPAMNAAAPSTGPASDGPPDRSVPVEAPMQSLLDRFSSP